MFSARKLYLCTSVSLHFFFLFLKLKCGILASRAAGFLSELAPKVMGRNQKDSLNGVIMNLEPYDEKINTPGKSN